MKLAALDVGTNTVRLLVASVGPGGLVPHRYALRITRLGGAATSAGLVPEALERTVAAVAELARIARADGATACLAVATSAAREARNRHELVVRVREAAGIDLEVVSGEEEAALTFTGVLWALGRLPGGAPDRFALVDVGGGSTELVLAERNAARWSTRVQSVPVGAVRLAERYLVDDPPTPDALARVTAAIEAGLAAIVPAAPTDPASAPRPLVGTAGTITTLAAMDLGLATYDRDRIHGRRLTRKALEVRLAQLGAMPAAARLALPGLERGREDLIVPGTAIVLGVMRRLGAPVLTVVDAGLIEGICLRRA